MGEFVVSPILMLTADTSVTFTTTVVIAGITIVLGVLLLLILVFYLFGFIVQKLESMSKARAEKKASKAQADAPTPVQAPAPIKPSAPAMKVEQGISGEVVAAIAAAVVASEGPQAVIRSIKKKNVGGRNPWAQAANIDNTKPF